MTKVRRKWIDRAERLGADQDAIAWLRAEERDVAGALAYLGVRWLRALTPEEHLELSRQSECCLFLAAAPSTPPSLLAQFATDWDWRVRAAVARNPAAPLATLARLSRDINSYVCLAILRRRDLPPRVLSRLADHGDTEVRAAVAEHPAATKRLLTRLAADHQPAVRKSAERALATAPSH